MRTPLAGENPTLTEKTISEGFSATSSGKKNCTLAAENPSLIAMTISVGFSPTNVEPSTLFSGGYSATNVENNFFFLNNVLAY